MEDFVCCEFGEFDGALDLDTGVDYVTMAEEEDMWWEQIDEQSSFLLEVLGDGFKPYVDLD